MTRKERYEYILKYFREQMQQGRMVDAEIEGRIVAKDVTKEQLQEMVKRGVKVEQINMDAIEMKE